MSGIYLDTGALVKLYVLEPGSEFVQSKIQSAGPLPLNDFQETELRTALAAAVGRKIITQSAYLKTLAHLNEDIQQGYFQNIDLDWKFVWRRAIQISLRHTPKILCRTLDILHVAAAEAMSADLFLSGDQRQIKLCKALKIPVTEVLTR